MPTFPRSPESSIHSWSFVYLRPVDIGPGPLSLCCTFVERHRHDARACQAAADVHFDLHAGRRSIDREIRHPDRLLEERCLGSACHDAARFAVDQDVMPLTRDPAVEHLEAHQLAADAPTPLLPEHRLSVEAVLLPADDPAQIGLEWGDGVVDV